MGCLIDMKVSKNRTASVTAFIEPMGGSLPPPPPPLPQPIPPPLLGLRSLLVIVLNRKNKVSHLLLNSSIAGDGLFLPTPPF